MRLAAALLVLPLLIAPALGADYHGAAHVDLSAQNPPVSYPLAAQRGGREGLVRMLVQVSDNGIPRRVKVVKSSGYEDLDDAAAAGVLRWHYVPATWGSDWADVQVEYKLPPTMATPVSQH
jgi:protein TonB